MKFNTIKSLDLDINCNYTICYRSNDVIIMQLPNTHKQKKRNTSDFYGDQTKIQTNKNKQKEKKRKHNTTYLWTKQ